MANMTTKLYAVYKLTSDLDDLPDEVIAVCGHCRGDLVADFKRTYIELDVAGHDCTICSS